MSTTMAITQANQWNWASNQAQTLRIWESFLKVRHPRSWWDWLVIEYLIWILDKSRALWSQPCNQRASDSNKMTTKLTKSVSLNLVKQTTIIQNMIHLMESNLRPQKITKMLTNWALTKCVNYLATIIARRLYSKNLRKKPLQSSTLNLRKWKL